jgi:hypothetical protein
MSIDLSFSQSRPLSVLTAMYRIQSKSSDPAMLNIVDAILCYPHLL